MASTVIVALTIVGVAVGWIGLFAFARRHPRREEGRQTTSFATLVLWLLLAIIIVALLVWKAEIYS